MSNSTQMATGLRLTIVDSVGSNADGDSLAGLNVNAFPEGALVWVRSANRFYQLKKNLPTPVIADVSAFKNVVAGVGSSSVDGFWVATNQFATGVLSGSGTVALAGFDLSTSGFFAVSYITPGGTQGFLHAAQTNDATVTVTSSSTTDTSTVLVEFIQQVGV
jgi:hypothetical protein